MVKRIEGRRERVERKDKRNDGREGVHRVVERVDGNVESNHFHEQ